MGIEKVKYFIVGWMPEWRNFPFICFIKMRRDFDWSQFNLIDNFLRLNETLVKEIEFFANYHWLWLQLCTPLWSDYAASSKPCTRKNWLLKKSSIFRRNNELVVQKTLTILAQVHFHIKIYGFMSANMCRLYTWWKPFRCLYVGHIRKLCIEL